MVFSCFSFILPVRFEDSGVLHGLEVPSFPTHSLMCPSPATPSPLPLPLPEPGQCRIWLKLMINHHPWVIFLFLRWAGWGRWGCYVYVSIFILFSLLLMILLRLGHARPCIDTNCTDLCHVCGACTVCTALSGLGQSPLCGDCCSNLVSPAIPRVSPRSTVRVCSPSKGTLPNSYLPAPASKRLCKYLVFSASA